MQEVIYTALHAGGDAYKKSRHLEVSNLGDRTGYIIRSTYLR